MIDPTPFYGTGNYHRLRHYLEEGETPNLEIPAECDKQDIGCRPPFVVLFCRPSKYRLRRLTQHQVLLGGLTWAGMKSTMRDVTLHLHAASVNLLVQH